MLNRRVPPHLEASESSWFATLRLRVMLATLLTLSFLLADVVSANNYSAAQKDANEFFKNRTWTAKLALETNGRYFMDPTGQPLETKKQGRRKRRGIGQRDIAFPVGAEGRGTYIRVDGSDREVVVMLQKKRGVTMHQTRMYIQYSRTITAADLEPNAIARALSPYVTFDGVNPDEAFSSALAAVETTTAATPTVADPSRATISGLEVLTTPTRVSPGEDVVLVLQFSVANPGGGSIDVTENRTLSLDGQRLPSFPLEHSEARAPGKHSSRYRQSIPASAAEGIYSFKGEVCLASDCVSRVVTFEIGRD